MRPEEVEFQVGRAGRRAEPPRLPLWRRILRCLSLGIVTDKGLDVRVAPAPPRVGSWEEQKDPGRTVVTVGGKIEF